MRRVAMIFAAGLGTRLFPITKDIPKALAQVNGKTLLEYAIMYVASFGFHDIIINTHHFSDKIESFLKDKSFENLHISISYEEKLLDTAGGLAFASHFFLPDDLILLYNVDILTNMDIEKMIVLHQNSNSDISLAVQSRKTSRYFLFDGDKKLQGWVNKLTKELIINQNVNQVSLDELAFNGIHLWNYNILRNLNNVEKISLTPFYLNKMSELVITGFEVGSNNYWFDCGKLETLEQASTFLLNNI
jgi:N-acetyl-alpha-D-muramate 1-phosphate uridylyltransferase